MSSARFLFALLAALALAQLAAAMPTVDLLDALNKTTCPIRVEIDENPDRVPRRIKLLKCAPDPSEWCVRRGVPRHECCQHTHHSPHHHFVMQCVEIHDTVLVRYLSSGKTRTYDVAVGCTCMVERSTEAEEAT